MKKKNRQGIMVDGSIRSAGVTFYTKQGNTIVRTSKSIQPKRCTELQLKQRERYSHSISLWFVLKYVCKPMMSSERRPYDMFRSLASKLETVYLTKDENRNGATLLMPGIPVSCGTLPDIDCRLGEVEGSPALLTDITHSALDGYDRLLLVEVEQQTGGSLPGIVVRSEAVTAADWRVVDGRIALVDGRFADSMRGWALVRRRRGRCSSQRIVSRCTYYRRYTTTEALQRAAESYGGLTG